MREEKGEKSRDGGREMEREEKEEEGGRVGRERIKGKREGEVETGERGGGLGEWKGTEGRE